MTYLHRNDPKFSMLLCGKYVTNICDMVTVEFIEPWKSERQNIQTNKQTNQRRRKEWHAVLRRYQFLLSQEFIEKSSILTLLSITKSAEKSAKFLLGSSVQIVIMNSP